MAKFLLILHQGPGSYHHLSPTEREQMFGKYQAWMEKLRAAGKLLASDKLREEGGKVLTQPKGKLTVVDGPYIEAKEVVGGYFLIQAASYQEATELARECPHLGFGRIEVRETDPMGKVE